MKALLRILCLCALPLFAQNASDSARTLRISSWPGGAELYIGERPHSFVQKSNFKSPYEIPVEKSDTAVRVTFFKAGYADTTLDIRIPNPGKNFVWISLREETDILNLEFQDAIFERRKDRTVGKVLFASSLVPFALAGTFAGLSVSKFHDADDAKEKIEKSIIREGEKYRSFERDFSDSKKSGKHYRTASAVSLGIGALLLATSVIFYF